MKRDIFSSPLLNSRIRSENIQKREQIFGYFLGPSLVYTMFNSVAGTYLIQFYTDVLGLAGQFLTMMPLVSKVISGIVSIAVGRMIDRTRTIQGKARPWLLISGILLAACGILLYAVPQASYAVQIIWIIISYNLFFSLAFSVYSLSHSLLVPLSTRDTKQRDKLAMLTSTGTAMIPGVLVTIVMPLVVKTIGVGTASQERWVTVMCILSILALPAVLAEYYFTKERITAQTQKADEAETISFGCQIKACFRDKYWVMIILFHLIIHLCNAFSNNSMLYYCNWVIGKSVENGAYIQILVNVIGQFPMGPGVVVLWPLVRRFGKQKVTVVGFLIATVGALTVLLAGDSLVGILAGLFVKSIGCLPAYVMTALLAEALDHVEYTNGFRADGFSAAVITVGPTIMMGLSQTILLSGISDLGYITPAATSQIIVQPDTIQTFFSWCFSGLPMIGYAACAMMMLFYRAEAEQPQITAVLAPKKENE